MSTALKAVSGLAACIPFACVVALAIYITAIGMEPGYGRAFIDLDAFTTRHLIIIGVSLVGIALLQIAIAAGFVVHATRNPALQSSGKVGWSLGVVLVGSLALPLYWTLYIRNEPAKAPAQAFPTQL